MTEWITLNAINHFTYCPHRWGLMFVENVWTENALTTAGHLFHERVHDAAQDESRPDKISVRGLQLFHEDLKINGIADLTEFVLDEKGGYTARNGRRYRPTVVEYKVGKPKTTDTIDLADEMQLIAQIVCMENMFGCPCDGALYYREINRRIRLTKTEEAKNKLLCLLEKMRSFLQAGEIPTERHETGCGGCSLKDQCLPTAKNADVFREIESVCRKENL